ncbi:MAG: hypothetical protein LH473_10270 [Chitinophagales bacterium]|nr:hypothetical protein [Chitinophagales bacterium]
MTIVEMSQRILTKEDDEVSGLMEKLLREILKQVKEVRQQLK